MGNPFVACEERGPQSPLTSHDGVEREGKLDSAQGATTLLSTESAPAQDALQAAESYFQHVRDSSSRNCNRVSHGPPRTLFESLLDETQEPTPIGEVALQRDTSKSPVQVEKTVSPGQWDSDLEVSPTEFSLDDCSSPPPEFMLSPSAEVGLSRTSPAQANSDLETPAELSLDDSDTSPDETMCSPEMVSGSDHRIFGENEMTVKGLNFASSEVASLQSPSDGGSLYRCTGGQQDSRNSLESGEQEDSRIGEVDQDVQDTLSKSEFEWRTVLRRSARSLDSMPYDCFKASRSAGISSANSRYSLSDEAISERAAAWGDGGVARLVLKNSSRESTPRTSTVSSVSDGLQHYGKKVPALSKHVKDAFTSFQLAFVVCDVINPDRPVLFASAGFFEMTGYSAEETIGRNCRFLQGVDTDAKEVARISTALKKGEGYSGTILNYKKNGTPFWNQLTLSPITDNKGVVIKYMGMQAEVKNNTMMARRKKKAHDINFKDTPRLRSLSIAEETSQSNSLSRRSEREEDVPIFALPSTPRVTATAHDSNGRSQGSKRYSLTYGTAGRSRSVELGPGHTTFARTERRSMPSERKRSGVALEHKPAKSASARPLYWLLTAARVLEEEIHHLGSNHKFAGEKHNEPITKNQESHEGGLKKRNKISRVAKGVFGLFRKLESKVFKRTSRAPIPSNRVNAYDSDAGSDLDDFQDIGNTDDLFSSEQQTFGAARCESMPHINYATGASAWNFGVQADLRARSNRYIPSSISDTSARRTSASNTNEFLLDRKQFCIVHE